MRKSTTKICKPSPWKLGQLVWARIGNLPFWPGIVTLDPNSMTFVSLKGKSQILHVRFCGDEVRHSWVPFDSIIPFLGLEDFEKKSKELALDIRKKEPKYAAAFVIKPGTKLQWDDAVSEATGLMATSIEKRNEQFNPKHEVTFESKPKASPRVGTPPSPSCPQPSSDEAPNTNCNKKPKTVAQDNGMVAAAASTSETNYERNKNSLVEDLAKRQFKGTKNERVCQICEQPGKLIRCNGPCYSYFHLECVKPGDSSPEPSEAGDLEKNPAYAQDLKIKSKVKENKATEDPLELFTYSDCLSGRAPPCFETGQRKTETFNDKFPNVKKNIDFIIHLAQDALLEYSVMQSTKAKFSLIFNAAFCLDMCKSHLAKLSDDVQSCCFKDYVDCQDYKNIQESLKKIVDKLEEIPGIKNFTSFYKKEPLMVSDGFFLE